MKILVAGASGAIGQPLIDLIIQEGHETYAIARSKEKALLLAGKGAKPVLLNILDREAVFSSIAAIKPDVVIDMLTHLPKEYTPEAMQQASIEDAKIRMEGDGHLHAAAELHGVKRYIVQSCGFWYAPGNGLAVESDPFAFQATPGIASGTCLYSQIEQRALESIKVEGVALRFGFFYGEGTWFHRNGSVAEQIRKKQFPVIGDGKGVWNFIHIEDAAKAVRTAIYSATGIYNIVNDRPSPMKEWLPAFARYLGAEPPRWISEEEGLQEKGADAVYYATQLRGASNQKAKQSFSFQPRTFEWFT